MNGKHQGAPERRYCIVGAGPAGLAMARAFKVRGIAFDVFEKHSDVGGIWDPENPGSPMYDSAHFISSKTLSGYYDYPMPDDYPDYPDNRRVLEYHRAFARDYGLYDDITFGTAIESIEDRDGAWWVTPAGQAPRRYAGVVCASGITWDPVTPEFDGVFNGEIMHSVQYRHRDIFRGKRVLVIGAGNSGCDIACDAASTADDAMISVRRGYYFIPKHLFGQPADVFASSSSWMPARLSQMIFGFLLKYVVVGDLTRLGLPAPDHRILESHPIVNDQLLHYLRHGDVRAKLDVLRFDGDHVEFWDGSRERVDLIVCATGYRWSIPYMKKSYFTWRGGRPDQYLTLFNREHENLFSLGYMETDGGAYKMFDDMADMIASYVDAKDSGNASAQKMDRLIRTDRPALNGGIRYLASDRHAAYVNKNAYVKYLRRLRKKLGWTGLRADQFESIRKHASETEQEERTRAVVR